MSKLHINRDRQSLGQFTPEQVAEGLAEGRFRPTDLAWRDGMETWLPLEQFTDLPTPPPATEIPEAEAAFPDAPPIIAEVAGDFPWDRRSETGFITGLWETLSGSLCSPGKLFEKLPAAPALGGPYAFYLLTALLTGIAATIATVFLIQYAVEVLATMPEAKSDPQMAKLLSTLKEFTLLPMLLPVFLVVPLVPFVAAGIYQGMLKLFGGANASFQKTFAVTCYVLGSASPFQLLPCCGPIVQVIWGIVSLSIGLGVAHRTDTWRATLAVVIPFLFCCGGYFALSLINAASSGALGVPTGH